jgi:hypothetical protein
MIVEHPDGTLFVAGVGGRLYSLWTASGIGVITPLQVALTGPVGFTYWRFEVR